jgi:hypothetical protein
MKNVWSEVIKSGQITRIYWKLIWKWHVSVLYYFMVWSFANKTVWVWPWPLTLCTKVKDLEEVPGPSLTSDSSATNINEGRRGLRDWQSLLTADSSLLSSQPVPSTTAATPIADRLQVRVHYVLAFGWLSVHTLDSVYLLVLRSLMICHLFSLSLGKKRRKKKKKKCLKLLLHRIATFCLDFRHMCCLPDK